MQLNSLYLEELKNKFKIIKEKGTIKSNRSHNTGIGKTFEDLLGKKEDNIAGPDYGDIEIKTQRALSNSFVTLFTKSPDYPKKANTYLRENFGVSNSDSNNLKILHTSLFGNSYNTFLSTYGFKAKVNRCEEKIYISIINLVTNELLSELVYYSFSTLKRKLDTKLKNLAYISANSSSINGQEYFQYTNIKFYYNPSFEKFLELIENGKIMIDIRIGVYHNPENTKTYGKTHDHGTGFRIKESDLPTLYEGILIE